MPERVTTEQPPIHVPAGRRPRSRATTAATLPDLAPFLIAGGMVLSIAGWTDVALFYIPSNFRSTEWEFTIIARTFDAMPLPTLGLLLLVLGFRARAGAPFWMRGL